jgi:hypothetical protein
MYLVTTIPYEKSLTYPWYDFGLGKTKIPPSSIYTYP